MKAIITIYPYRGPSFRGWTVVIRDPSTDEVWQRLFYYKLDAKLLTEELRGKTLEEILDIYGTKHFVRVL